jgi:parallel beta-helix repeat protein
VALGGDLAYATISCVSHGRDTRKGHRRPRHRRTHHQRQLNTATSPGGGAIYHAVGCLAFEPEREHLRNRATRQRRQQICKGADAFHRYGKEEITMMRAQINKLVRVLPVAVLLLFSSAVAAQARVIPVRSTIQAAVDAAKPGDVVLVPGGTYHENVVVSTDGVSIVGLPRAVLDGTGTAGRIGIRVAPSSPLGTLHEFRLQGLRIEHYAGDGVLLRHVAGFTIVGNHLVDNDDYGVFPVLSGHGLIAADFASGSGDTGIYVGQSSDVIVAADTAESNTVGFDIENSTRVTAAGNRAMGNSIGLIVQGAPGLTVPNATDVIVTGNQLSNNNRPNPSTDPLDLLSRLPAGTGLLTVDADRVTIANNVVARNHSSGIALISLPPDVAALDPRLDPIPDGDHITNNTVLGNGLDPTLQLALFPPADLLWDGTGTGNCWTGNTYTTAFPSQLPICDP